MVNISKYTSKCVGICNKMFNLLLLWSSCLKQTNKKKSLNESFNANFSVHFFGGESFRGNLMVEFFAFPSF